MKSFNDKVLTPEKYKEKKLQKKLKFRARRQKNRK